MIPQGWRQAPLHELIASLDAGVSVNSEDRPKQQGEIGVLKVSTVTYGRFDPSAHKVVLKSEEHRVTVPPCADSIIVSRANTYDLVGASAYVDRDYPDLFLSDKLWRILVNREYTSTRWLSYVLAARPARSAMTAFATGTSGSMKNISQEEFLSIPVLVPPLPEQRRIAEILGAWDDAIALTGRLIDALKRRKRGLMQRLLTGQIRFSEFEGQKWNRYELGELTTPIARPEAVNPDKSYSLIGVRWYVAGAHIHEVLSGAELAIETLSMVHENDIIYNKMWATKSAFAIAKRQHDGAFGTSEYPQFRVIPDRLDVGFLEFLFNDSKFQHDAKALCRGTTGRARLNPRDFAKIVINIPSVAEQSRIAGFLNACQQELEIISAYLTYLQAQKKGLMQRLLTGQIRVRV